MKVLSAYINDVPDGYEVLPDRWMPAGCVGYFCNKDLPCTHITPPRLTERADYRHESKRATLILKISPATMFIRYNLRRQAVPRVYLTCFS